MISPPDGAAIHFIVTSRRCQAPAKKLNTGNPDQRYHRFMSETPPTGHPSAPGPVGFPPGLPPPGPWGPPGPIAPSKPARWPVVVMFLITLVAVGAAVAAWLRPIPNGGPAVPSAPTYSDQEAADAKAKVCAAYAKVGHAADMNANRTGGDDPTAQLAVSVNERQVFEAGSAYLLTTLSEQPATPAELAKSIRALTDLYQVMIVNGLASDPSLPEKQEVTKVASTIDGMCK
jgi:hypothetical protein